MTVEALSATAARAPIAGGLVRDALRHLVRNPSAVTGMVILAVFLFAFAFAPLIATHDPNEPLIGLEAGVKKRAGPCIYALGCPADQPQHYFGTDGNVRDEFSRVVFGTRVSLPIGFLTVGFAIVLGTFLGAIAGYVGGWWDNSIMRVMDVLLAFPSLLLAIAIVTLLGPGLINALIAIGIVQIPVYARIVRSSVISVRELDFVTADRALGASPGRILFRRILPNALTPLIVQGTLGIATAVLDAAAISFLGLGAQPPDAEWGRMISDERSQIFTAPHLIFLPGLALMLTVLAFNLLGDGLRDALDPRLHR